MRCRVRFAGQFASTVTGGLALVLLGAAALPAQHEAKLAYQYRGDRNEGVKPRPVAGYDVELLSALVQPREELRGWPDQLRVRFYLAAADSVYLTVRELRPREYYWLDKARPPSPWRGGEYNDFAWPTEPVLKRLTSLRMSDLGVVVRLQRKEPGKKEVVAPALFFHSEARPVVEGYRFTFKTNGSAQVTCRIYRGEREVFHRPQSWEAGGVPFSVRWSIGEQPEGWYRLVISGYFESDNSRLDKEVRFYHRPSPRAATE